MKVPHDVFHNNDGIINQNSDAEDEGKEGDAIKRETQEVEDEQRERERGGYGNRNNQRKWISIRKLPAFRLILLKRISLS
jgi:hypothetical protein